MKRKKMLLIGMTSIVSFCWLLVGSSALAESSKYRDVPDGYPYQTYIDELSSQMLIEGTADGQFAPDLPLTREQFAKLVVTAFKLPASEGNLPFQDCTEAWSKSYILSAYRAGIIQGTSEDRFSPELHVSKQEASIMLTRLFPTDVLQKNELNSSAGALNFVRNNLLTIPMQSLLNDEQAPLSRGEAAALISLSLHAWKKGSTSEEPMPIPFSGQATAYHKDNWFQLELKSKQYIQLQMDRGRIVDIQDPMHSRIDAAEGSSSAFTAKDEGRYLIHVTDLQPGAILTSSDGMTLEHALSLDPSNTKDVTVDVHAGETLFVQGKLKKHTTYELEAVGDNQSLFDMMLSDAEGAARSQGYVSALQITTGADGLILGSIRPDRQGGAISLRIFEVGADTEDPITLKVGRFHQIFPKEGSLYYKVVADPDNPVLIQAIGAESYQRVQLSKQWVPPTLYPGLRITTPDGNQYGLDGKPITDVSGHVDTDINVSSNALHNEPFAINCTCGVKISAPGNSEVSFTVMDGGSISTAYAIGWIGREWKSGYRKSSISGIFYSMVLEQGRNYTFTINEQSNPNFTSPTSTAEAKRKMTVYGPDGKPVLVDEKLAGTISFKAAQTGNYIVEFQSDAQDHMTEIKVNDTD